MQLISKFSFEVRTELRSYQFVLNPDSPIEELLQVLQTIQDHYKEIKEKSDEKAKLEEQQPVQE